MAEKRSNTREEKSAGVIVFREGERGRLFLLLDYGRYWDFPKGHVEKGEDDEAAARRELEEETGIAATELLDGFEEEIVYFFRKGPALIRKRVVFFLGRTEEENVRVSDEHCGYAWMEEPEARKRIKYPTAKKVFEAAVRFLAGV